MIKIIKEGKLKHETTCKDCGCVFEYEVEDVTRRTVWDDHGGHYPVCDFFDVICPFCNKKISMYKEQVNFTKQEIEEMKHIDQ